MNCSKLISWCEKLPYAHCEIKWRDTLVFMVRKKMFALFVMDANGKPRELWCKVDDDLFLSYTGQDGIRPAPYLARARWIAMEPKAMSDADARRILNRARDIIFTKLPKRTQQELLAQQD